MSTRPSMLSRTAALAVMSGAAAAAGRRGFQAGRVLDPELRRQLPARVPRDEFTVLKCLAGTVGIDADSVPHYAIDDSMFLRYNQANLALARRSGRNLAHYLMEKHAAQLADLNKECPPVPAWRPLRPVDQLECCEDSLRLLIRLGRVGTSWQMYNKLVRDKGGSDVVGDDTRQSLLELLAYHAGVESPLGDISPEEIYFAERPLQDSGGGGGGVFGNHWSGADNPARVLYASLTEPSLAAKAAMLKAHWRHGSHAECLAVYAEVADNPALDAGSHHCAMLATATHKRSWPDALAVFRRLPRLDATAYRCLLNALAAATAAKGNTIELADRARLVCSILAEMSERRLLPLTLGVCAAALKAVYGERLLQDSLKGPSDWISNPGEPDFRVGFLPSLLDALAANPPDPLDADSPDDLAFFPAAAYLAWRVYCSRALSEQLDVLLHSGAFVSTLGSLRERRHVYEYHLVNLITDPTAPLDVATRFFADRMVPSGTSRIAHLVRLMRRCVARQAVSHLPSLMLHCVALVDRLGPDILQPGRAFFRCAEICCQMFDDGHPATRDADYLADLRRCLVGFADVLNNDFIYRRRPRDGDEEQGPQDLKSSLNAESCATILRLATRLPGTAEGVDRDHTLQLAGMLSECLADQRTSCLDYMLALMELSSLLQAGPQYEQRSICQSVALLLDRAAHEFHSKRSDKSDVARLDRLAALSESARAYLASGGHQLTDTQAAGHLRLARGAAELRNRGGDSVSGANAASVSEADNPEQDDAAWGVDYATAGDRDVKAGVADVAESSSDEDSDKDER